MLWQKPLGCRLLIGAEDQAGGLFHGAVHMIHIRINLHLALICFVWFLLLRALAGRRGKGGDLDGQPVGRGQAALGKQRIADLQPAAQIGRASCRERV